MEETMIQAICRKPNTTPNQAASEIKLPGILRTKLATRIAVIMPHIAENQTRFLRTNRTKKRTRTGSIATAVDKGQLPQGS